MIRATLALADGTVFEGTSCGAEGETVGEVVFNTSLTGYQEILTDPSYAYQLLTFTYPHIGNVGVNPLDVESNKVQVAGMIVREFSERSSNFRSAKSLRAYLEDNAVVGISDIDTRELVMHLRDKGAQMGVIATGEHNPDDLVDKARAATSIVGLNLAKEVTADHAYDWIEGEYELSKNRYRQYTEEELRSRPLVVALDFGVKFNILRLLIGAGFQVRVVPAETSAEAIRELSPDALFLSNGPGDPAAVERGIATTKKLLGTLPIFGICLGHQILGHACGVSTYKLPFGHRGGNHPVRNERTGVVEITVQNHGFASRDDAQASVVSHINLNDNTVEGFEMPDAKAFSVQYHPEASPGPHDARYLFQKFYRLVETGEL